MIYSSLERQNQWDATLSIYPSILKWVGLWTKWAGTPNLTSPYFLYLLGFCFFLGSVDTSIHDVGVRSIISVHIKNPMYLVEIFSEKLFKLFTYTFSISFFVFIWATFWVNRTVFQNTSFLFPFLSAWYCHWKVYSKLEKSISITLAHFFLFIHPVSHASSVALSFTYSFLKSSLL